MTGWIERYIAPRPEQARPEVERVPVAGVTCPQCGSDDVRRYPIASHQGPRMATKCQACLHALTVERPAAADNWPPFRALTYDWPASPAERASREQGAGASDAPSPMPIAMGNVAGKTIVLTGAASGIGRALALRLGRGRARLALIDRDADGLGETGRLVAADGGDAITLAVDLSERPAIESCLADIVDRFGHLDALVNNAGRIQSAPLAEHTPELWDELFAINARSQFLMAREALPALLAGTNPSIVNIASIAALRGYNNLSGYAASKAAVMGLTQSLALELAPQNIRVNAVAPGTTDTPMPRAATAHLAPEVQAVALERYKERQMIKRRATPDEVASLIHYLLSDDAAFITGAIIPVDGGLSAW